MTTEAATQMIQIPPLNIGRIVIPIVGDTPLVCHAWAKKARQLMLDRQMKKPAAKLEAKNPLRDFAESLYWISGRPRTFGAKAVATAVERGRFGFPTKGLKKAMVDACRNVANVPMKLARGAFHINGELLEIEGDKPIMREDMVRLQGRVADIRYRGEFTDWLINVPIRYNQDVITAEQVTHLLNVSGFAIGIGENRPQCDGQWGMYSVK